MNAPAARLRLEKGNRRYVAGTPEQPRRDVDTRRSLVSGQSPWAMVLTCADSRVVPEVLFDVGLGDLFVVRVAGNVATPGAVGSLELGAAELDCPLLVVLGHTSCGAVQATLAHGQDLPGQMAALAREVARSCDPAARPGAERVDDVVERNVVRQVETLRRTPPILAERVADGRLEIAGAVYDLDSGRVAFLD
jgi:carbonic anhydrase